MDQKQWAIVFSTSIHYQAEIVKQMLESNDVEAVVMDKQDTSYPMLGEADVFVVKENEEFAKKLIQGFEI
jgi:hypothetical protein